MLETQENSIHFNTFSIENNHCEKRITQKMIRDPK
jgi:hypothetical protein